MKSNPKDPSRRSATSGPELSGGAEPRGGRDGGRNGDDDARRRREGHDPSALAAADDSEQAHGGKVETVLLSDLLATPAPRNVASAKPSEAASTVLLSAKPQGQAGDPLPFRPAWSGLPRAGEPAPERSPQRDEHEHEREHEHEHEHEHERERGHGHGRDHEPAGGSTGTVSLSDLGPIGPALPFAPKTTPAARSDPNAATDATEAATTTTAATDATEATQAATRTTVTSAGVRLINLTPLAADVIAWGPELSRSCLSLVAKGRFTLVAGGPARLDDGRADPHETGQIEHAGELGRDLSHELSAERWVEDGLGLHCVYPEDRVPFKVRTDVLLIGQAVAPRPGTRQMRVGLSLSREGLPLVDREIEVFGPRQWQRGRAGYEPSLPEPFTTVPLCHALAFGGEGYPPNPVGQGLRRALRRRDERPVLPQLEDPHERLRTPGQKPPPACFAPRPQRWNAPSASPEDAGRRSLGDRFDWTQFQAAPPSLQCAPLRGDESFVLRGLRPEGQVLEGTLPGLPLRAVVLWPRASGPAGGGQAPAAPALDPPRLELQEVPLKIDTLLFQPTAMTLTIVWRAIVPVVDECRPQLEAIYLIGEDLSAPSEPLDALDALDALDDLDARLMVRP